MSNTGDCSDAVYECPCPQGCGRTLRGVFPRGRSDVLFVECRPCNIEGWRHVSKFTVTEDSDRREDGS